MRRLFFFVCISLASMCYGNMAFAAQGVVPGTGTLVEYVGDTFEEGEWEFITKGSKSSKENDGQSRAPLGYSVNRRWFEGPERGYPDLLKVVPTPPGGLEGSERALLIRTLHSGIPNQLSRGVQQDDLIVDCIARLGTAIRPSELPNCVVRVYLPPAEKWENRSGPHFGFRIGLSTTKVERTSGRFGLSSTETVAEPYWPGMWIHFRSETDSKVDKDSAFLKVRGDRNGRDFYVREMEQFGWWTLGMSVTSDGAVHYYAHPGIEDLTAGDHISSQYPYSFRAEQFRTFFFNICNRDDGASWSTPFVIDDPQMFVVNSSRVDAIVERKMQHEQRAASSKNRSGNTTRNR